MHSKQDLKSMGQHIVYAKIVDVADLPDDVREQTGDAKSLIAIHNFEGEQVALVANSDVASHLADANDLQLVAMH